MNKWLKIGMASSAIGAFCGVLTHDWVMVLFDVTMFCSFVLDSRRGG